MLSDAGRIGCCRNGAREAACGKGHEIHFITHSIPFRLGKFHKNIYYHEVEVNDYYVFRYPPYDLSLASKMAQVAKMQELDLLHVHYAVPHALCAFLAKQMVGDHLELSRRCMARILRFWRRMNRLRI